MICSLHVGLEKTGGAFPGFLLYHLERVGGGGRGEGRGGGGGGGGGEGGASRKCSEQDRAEGDSRHSQLNWNN